MSKSSSPIPFPANSVTLPPPIKHHISNYDQKLQNLINHFSSPVLILPQTLKTYKAFQKSKPKSSYGNFIAHRDLAKSYSTSKSSSGDAWTGLSDREKFFLTREQLARFLRAVKGDEEKALERSELTVVWRREYGVEELTEDVVEEESRTGKQLVLGYDNHCRPCLYMHPYRQNTKVSPRQIQFVVWTLERAIDLMSPGVENICLMIDFGSGNTGGNPTTLGQARKVLEILQTYYCERLGRAICVNVPLLFWGFYKLVGPFVDPVTKEKIKFNPDVRELVPPEQLEKSMFKGDLDFDYVHEKFYPAVTKLCRERRDEHFNRWKSLGGKVGLSEWQIRGGDELDDSEIPPEGIDSNPTTPSGASESLQHIRRQRTKQADVDCADGVEGDKEVEVETPDSSIFRGKGGSESSTSETGSSTPSSIRSYGSQESDGGKGEGEAPEVVTPNVDPMNLIGLKEGLENLETERTPRDNKTQLQPDNE